MSPGPLRHIHLSSPDITELECQSVLAVVRSGRLSFGPKVQEFEMKFAEFIGTKYAVAVSSGTAGLHLCVKALNISSGDEVITTPFSFVASANCVLYEDAVPIFVDVDSATHNLNVNLIESKITKRTRAIVPVHVFGHPCEMDQIQRIANKYHLAVIEDACEALGSTYRQKKVGTFGDCAVFAFYPNKQMTTGEGGMIVTNDPEIDEMCRSLRNQGRDQMGPWLAHKILGYNYRLNDIQSALGIAQLSRIEELIEKRARAAEFYRRRLKNEREFRIPRALSHVNVNWFVFVITLAEEFSADDRNAIMQKLRSKGVECSQYFPSIHLQPYFQKKFKLRSGDFPVSESLSDRTIALPFHNNLTEEDVDYVARCLESSFRELESDASPKLVAANV